ncbi:MAG TPA: hypothetical protein VG711_05010, partial [Phycisphaerales bacterium]|nr:hypothetical protein [Phycisphaerales bacterium]
HVESQFVEKTKLCDMAEKQLSERNAEIQERLSELEKERSGATEGIPEDVLATFDELADYFEGEALAAVEEIDRRNREYVCGSCHIHLPFSLVAKLITLTDSVERCCNCSRILYMQPDMKGSFARK